MFIYYTFTLIYIYIYIYIYYACNEEEQNIILRKLCAHPLKIRIQCLEKYPKTFAVLEKTKKTS